MYVVDDCNRRLGISSPTFFLDWARKHNANDQIIANTYKFQVYVWNSPSY